MHAGGWNKSVIPKIKFEFQKLLWQIKSEMTMPKNSPHLKLHYREHVASTIENKN